MKPITQPSRRYAGSCGIRLSDLVGALIALSQIIARGQPRGPAYAGVAAFHDHAHKAIVRCFAAITTPEMHKLWERYQ